VLAGFAPLAAGTALLRVVPVKSGAQGGLIAVRAPRGGTDSANRTNRTPAGFTPRIFRCEFFPGPPGVN
jgi:hypothetical protein